MVTLPDEVKDRVLSYIKHQAEKSAPALRDVACHRGPVAPSAR